MLSTEWDWEEALKVAREEGWEDGLEEGMERAHEEAQQYFLELLNQGLTIEEIKQRLNQKEAVFFFLLLTLKMKDVCLKILLYRHGRLSAAKTLGEPA
jgi:hypothetical protein